MGKFLIASSLTLTSSSFKRCSLWKFYLVVLIQPLDGALKVAPCLITTHFADQLAPVLTLLYITSWLSKRANPLLPILVELTYWMGWKAHHANNFANICSE